MFRSSGIFDTPGMSAFLSLSAFFLPLLYDLIFFLIYLLRFRFLSPILQHVRQHAVIFFIKLCIACHIPADLLLTDPEAFHHLAIQDLIS